MSIEIEVSAFNNAEGKALEVGEYGAEVAKEYADKAFEYAESAKESKNLAEAWAESNEPPTGSETRSAKNWADVARQWAESDADPDGITDVKSAKSWSSLSKEYANNASKSAIASSNSALNADSSAKASSDSANAAAISEKNSANSETSARQSAENAASSLEKLETVELPLKADLASPSFTGSPKVPTAAQGNSSQIIASTSFVQTAIAALVASAPGTLDTLKELAAALGNDPNFATTITNLIAEKLDKTANAVSATKAVQDGYGNNIVSTYATKTEMTGGITKLSTVASTGSYSDLLNKPTIPNKTSQLTNDSNYVVQDTSGNVTIAGTLTAAKVVNAYYNDYAEFFPRGGETETGDIIALADGGKECYEKATDKSIMVVGVHSDEYAQIIGGETDENGNVDIGKVIQNYIPVALAGRVHVKFYGTAIAGMKVVPSETPGVGRAFTEGDKEDSVVGRIVASDSFQNVRRVKIMVRRQ